MKLYAIRDWSKHFENNRSRELKSLDWVPIPNSHDGENFSIIMQHKNGAEIFAAWVLMVEVASKCDPRGTLLRGGGKPHSAATLSLKTRAPEKWFDTALSFLEQETDWLDVKQLPHNPAVECENPAPSCDNPASGCLEGKGREGKGKKRMELLTQARVVIHFLNEQAGAKFRESESSFDFIVPRLEEPDVTLDGVKAMIARQAKMWSGTDMAEYLRPSTLFNKTKFDGYYASKDLPLPSNGTSGQSTRSKVVDQELDRELRRIETL